MSDKDPRGTMPSSDGEACSGAIHIAKVPTAHIFYDLLPATRENNLALSHSFQPFAWICHLVEASTMHDAQDGFPIHQLILPLLMLQITFPVSMFLFTSSSLCDTRDTYSHDGKRRSAYIYSAWI